MKNINSTFDFILSIWLINVLNKWCIIQKQKIIAGEGKYIRNISEKVDKIYLTHASIILAWLLVVNIPWNVNATN